MIECEIYFNLREEDIKVYDLVKSYKNIKSKFIGPVYDFEIPVLFYGIQRFYGIEEICNFLEKYKND